MKTKVHDLDGNIIKGCKQIAWLLQNKYKEDIEKAIELYIIIDNSGKDPEVCRWLADCYIQVHKYV